MQNPEFHILIFGSLTDVYFFFPSILMEDFKKDSRPPRYNQNIFFKVTLNTHNAIIHKMDNIKKCYLLFVGLLLICIHVLTGSAYPSGAPVFTPGFEWGSCYSIFTFMCMICRSLFVLFRLFVVLSVLRFTDSDYPSGIFKLFLTR